jgi:hypothetical protein
MISEEEAIAQGLAIGTIELRDLSESDTPRSH